MTVSRFCDKHQIQKETIYATKVVDKHLWLRFDDEGNRFIDEDYLIEVAANRKRLWLASHEYYYYFNLVIGLRDMDLARLLQEHDNNFTVASFNEFVAVSMFGNNQSSIVNTTINGRLLSFIEFSEKAIPMFDRKLKGSKEYQEKLKEIR